MTSSHPLELIGRHRRAWTAGLATFAFAAVAVLAAACGGGGSGGSGGSANAVAHLATTSTTSGAGAAAGAGAPATSAPASSAPASGAGPNSTNIGADLMKFSSCMRSHGLPNFPNPVITSNGSGPQSVSLHITGNLSKASPQFQHAAQSCAKYAPHGRASENITTAQQADYVKAAQCMRAHGINGFPDPQFSGGSVRFPLPQSMNPNTPQFEAARHVCQNLIPNGLPYSSTDENP